MDHAGIEADVAAVASLAEPTRRALYLYVRAQRAPVSRDDAAAGLGVPRHTAKFHLDKLVEDGLLVTEFARRTGRRGPGAGRPAKLYRPATRELAITVPERRYQLAGQLMAGAISDSRGKDVPATEALLHAAADHGRWLAERATPMVGDSSSHLTPLGAALRVLEEEGYEPREDPDGLILANCPFRALAVENTAVICSMNLAIIEGLLAGLDKQQLTATLEPEDGRCCVRLAATGKRSG